MLRVYVGGLEGPALLSMNVSSYEAAMVSPEYCPMGDCQERRK